MRVKKHESSVVNIFLYVPTDTQTDSPPPEKLRRMSGHIGLVYSVLFREFIFDLLSPCSRDRLNF